MDTWLPIPIAALGLLLVALVLVVVRNRARLDRQNAQLVRELRSSGRAQAERAFQVQDLEGLPPPVQRYLAAVIPEGQPYVRTVCLEQRGGFRLGDATAPWKPLAATQHFAVEPPGFVWEATIDIAPLLRARVVDRYVAGQGALWARVLSTISVAYQGPGPEMNAGELMRYLAEAVWFPTLFLPGQGVTWTGVDGASARATLTDSGTSVSLLFHFDARDLVDWVRAEARYRAVDGAFEPTPWTGHFRNYQPRNGLLIPLDGQVAWNLPEGDLPYWRGHIEDIQHQF